MKKGSKNCCIITIAGLIIGFIVFYLLSIGCMYVSPYSFFFISSIAVGTISLLGFLIATLTAKKSKALKDAFCCCGNLAVIGGVGAVFVAFLTSIISYCCFIIYFIGVALTIFFLTLLLGGIWCFLSTYNNCEKKCICKKQCVFEDDDLQEDIND